MAEDKSAEARKEVVQADEAERLALEALKEKEAALVRELDRVLQPAVASKSVTVRHRAEAVRGVATLFTATGEENYYGELARNEMVRYDGKPNGAVLFFDKPSRSWKVTLNDDREGRIRFMRYQQVLPVLRLMVGMSYHVLAEASSELAVDALLHEVDELMNI